MSAANIPDRKIELRGGEWESRRVCLGRVLAERKETSVEAARFAFPSSSPLQRPQAPCFRGRDGPFGEGLLARPAHHRSGQSTPTPNFESGLDRSGTQPGRCEGQLTRSGVPRPFTSNRDRGPAVARKTGSSCSLRNALRPCNRVTVQIYGGLSPDFPAKGFHKVIRGSNSISLGRLDEQSTA
jgi:hypothetical protein